MAAALLLAQSCGQGEPQQPLGPTGPPASPALVGLSIVPRSAQLFLNDSLALVAYGHFRNGDSAAVPVVWSSRSGQISDAGWYHALQGGPDTVVASSKAQPTLSSAAALQVVTLLQLALSPAAVTLAPGQPQQFTVAGSWSDSSATNPSVTYAATGGTITPGGLYTAGPSPGTYRVIATHQTGTKADTAIVTIALPVTLLQLILTPASLTLAPSAAAQFTVAASWSDGSTTVPAVTWAATGGAITPGGLYTADSAAGIWRVIATQVDGTLADTSLVTITPPVPPRPLLGVHSDVMWKVDGAFRTRAIGAARDLKAEVARVGLLWMWIEFARGKQDWTIPDGVIQGLTDAGIEPLLVVYGSPPWANGVSSQGNFYHYLHVPTDPVAFQNWVEAYRTFVAQTARRYQGRVRKWELWSEPNDAFFWRPAPRVDQYATWFTSVRDAILAEDPGAQIASGGLNQLVVSYDQNLSGRAFLQGLYDRHLYPDIVAIHPYSNQGQSPDQHIPGAGNFDDIDQVLAVMSQNSQGQRKLWVTEWGWSTAKVSEAAQAEYLTRSLQLLSTRYAPWVTVATYFSEFDTPPAYAFGLYSTTWTPKAAGIAFRQFLQDWPR
jgi:hypothetical protein